MPDSTDSVQKQPALVQRLKQLVVPVAILLMAVGIVFLIAGNWNTWASERASQETDDAYTRADLTPLSTKVAGLVATVAVSDYQPVKSGDLLVQLRDDCFKPANLFFPNFQRKRFKIKQIGRIKSVYLVQSLHAPHSK